MISKEFTLRHKSIWDSAKNFVESNYVAFIDKNSPLVINVSERKKKRSTDQNRRYWGYILKAVSEGAWVNGNQFDQEVWHEYFARKYGYLTEMVLPDGEIITTRKSTTQMTVKEFGDYMMKVEAEAVSDLGIDLG